MPAYILLGNFTEQGIRNVKDTTKRVEAVRALAKKSGVTIKDVYWTQGQFDIAAILDAPDEAALASFTLSIGATGNVRTQTLRAFNVEEMAAILGRLA